MELVYYAMKNIRCFNKKLIMQVEFRGRSQTIIKFIVNELTTVDNIKKIF